jgi:hypothetical protein
MQGVFQQNRIVILLKNPLAKACFMLIDVERRMIFHCGSAWQ